ncbi:hypothetical protein PR048_004323 [Dryococelus australis]|uniref:Uncharacterized protein n=1 Tax=Dryococelus australis TaxID=614101 RepID=A0ABQ9I558_9NEOP|nr:hypothetical protein PR048_004323 [Dryococelus australis]
MNPNHLSPPLYFIEFHPIQAGGARSTQILVTHTTCRGRGGIVVRPVASHQGETGSMPGGVAPAISPVSPAPFIPTLLHTHLASPSSARKTDIYIDVYKRGPLALNTAAHIPSPHTAWAGVASVQTTLATPAHALAAPRESWNRTTTRRPANLDSPSRLVVGPNGRGGATVSRCFNPQGTCDRDLTIPTARCAERSCCDTKPTSFNIIVQLFSLPTGQFNSSYAFTCPLQPRQTGFYSRQHPSQIFASGNRARPGFLGGLPFPPLFQTHSPRFALIGSQDLVPYRVCCMMGGRKDPRGALIGSRLQGRILLLPQSAEFAAKSFRQLSRGVSVKTMSREPMKVWSNARMQRRGKTGDPRENPSTSGIVRHDSHTRKPGTFGQSGNPGPAGGAVLGGAQSPGEWREKQRARHVKREWGGGEGGRKRKLAGLRLHTALLAHIVAADVTHTPRADPTVLPEFGYPRDEVPKPGSEEKEGVGGRGFRVLLINIPRVWTTSAAEASSQAQTRQACTQPASAGALQQVCGVVLKRGDRTREAGKKVSRGWSATDWPRGCGSRPTTSRSQVRGRRGRPSACRTRPRPARSPTLPPNAPPRRNNEADPISLVAHSTANLRVPHNTELCAFLPTRLAKTARGLDFRSRTGAGKRNTAKARKASRAQPRPCGNGGTDQQRVCKPSNQWALRTQQTNSRGRRDTVRRPSSWPFTHESTLNRTTVLNSSSCTPQKSHLFALEAASARMRQEDAGTPAARVFSEVTTAQRQDATPSTRLVPRPSHNQSPSGQIHVTETATPPRSPVYSFTLRHDHESNHERWEMRGCDVTG